VFDRSDAVSFGGVVSGSGSLAQYGSGTLVLTGANTYTGGTTITAGTLQGDSTSLQGNIVDNAALVFEQTTTGTFAGAISGSGSLAQSGTGTLILSGANTYTGGTTINAGTLQVGAGGTTGAITGNVTDNSALVFDRSDALNFAGIVSGSGALTQAGNGTLTLDGDSSGFAGSTTVAAGTLVVGSTAGNGAALGGNVTVDSGATLGGHGRIGGNVDVLGGAHLAPGHSIGTLTVDGDFTAAQGSMLDFEVGMPGANFQTAGSSDSVHVGGNLELDGATLHLTDAGGFGPGLYNLFTWGGTLTQSNGGLTLGGGQNLFLQTLTAQQQINLINTTGYTVDAWNANGLASTTQMGGGSGTWSATSQVWTDATGTAPNGPMSPQPGFALFGGTAGAVMVDDGTGAVSATGMQFATDGYTLGGDTLTLVGSNGIAPVIRVGDGSGTGAGMTATIGNVLAGSDGLTKSDLGTLVLAGTNTYSGGTTISGGTLSVATDANLGDAGGGLTLDGGVLQVTGTAFNSTARTLAMTAQGGGFDIADASNRFTVAQALSGSGALSKAGAGTLVLTGANTYSGGTTISAGTLQVGNGGTTGSISGNVTNDSSLAFDRSDAVSFGGVVSGSGSLVKLGAGTLTLTGINSYTGGTTIHAGTLQVGNGGTTGAITGNVTDNGTLAFNRSDAVNFGGVVSGSGALIQSGTGTLLLTGANTYSGGTKIQAGTMQIGEGGTTGAITGNVTNDSALVFDRSDALNFAGIVSGRGALTQEIGRAHV
jgi:autotransporter-associated beta strand protein